MTSLINPNIAYLLLLFGTIALFLAMVTPGTGLIEGVAALFLFLAAYMVFQLGFNWWALVILILSLVPFIYAIRKKDRNWALALSILFVIAGSLYLFPGKGLLPAVNPILAVVMSVLSGGFLWLVTRKLIQAIRAKPMQDPARVVGQIGEARSKILENGSVQLESELWSARSKVSIPAGSRVRVVGRDGFTLLVEREDHLKK
jgi:membrane-bound serine protease (ClpP class)